MSGDYFVNLTLSEEFLLCVVRAMYRMPRGFMACVCDRTPNIEIDYIVIIPVP